MVFSTMVSLFGVTVALSEFPAPRYVTQLQDHFNASSSITWQQAYYVNDTFWTPGSDAPVFLCVGGEGPPIDGSAVVSSVHCNDAVEWLPETRALMFALEHRYYGCHNMSACPVKMFTGPESLKFLSSRQAVEDIAVFVKAMNRAYGLTSSNRWVTWGGSLPGMLAGWSRLRHPNLIHAAVASSAPVRIVVDMREYNDHVAYAFTVAHERVGGSAACRDAIRRGHRAIEELFNSTAGIAEVERRFGLATGALTTHTARRQFAGYGVAMFDAQDDDPACSEVGCNIRTSCELMLNESHGDEVQRLVLLRQAQGLGDAVSSVQPARSRLDVSKNQSTPTVDDFWFYQTCMEFAGYMTCHEDSDCMFVRGLVDLHSEAGDCQHLYNISLDDIAEHVAAMNKHYGSVRPAGSCVLWTNGEVDPFTPMGVLEAPNPRQSTLLVPGASHHAWTHPSRPSMDQLSVEKARVEIRAKVREYLGADYCMDAGPSRVAIFV